LRAAEAPQAAPDFVVHAASTVTTVVEFDNPTEPDSVLRPITPTPLPLSSGLSNLPVSDIRWGVGLFTRLRPASFTNFSQTPNTTEDRARYPGIHMRNTLNRFVAVLFLAASAFPQSRDFKPSPSAGPGAVLVHTKFGGQIFGFDIDQTGTEGLLSEAKNLSSGKVLAAVETFDQTTGQILKVVSKTETGDNFITAGIVGNSVGLVQLEIVQGIFVAKRTFPTLNPLDGNEFTAAWTPPIGSQHLIMPGGVSESQGVPNVAVFAYDNSGNFIPYVFSSDVAANTFGPVVSITDSTDFGSVPPPIAYDSVTNQAILGGGPGCFLCFPVIGVVNLTTAQFSTFTGVGFGFINGIAVDSEDGIFCTTTEDDAGVEFYDLATQTGFKVILPGSDENQIFSGADVQFDSLHKLFLIAQPTSSTASSGSAIYVYNTQGKLQETLNGFSFSNSFNVVSMHIGLNPGNRSGFVNGPDVGVLQSFTY